MKRQSPSRAATVRLSSRKSSPSRSVSDEFAAWMAKYSPAERAIIKAREERLARKIDQAQQSDTLCEATADQAKTSRSRDLSLDKQILRTVDDVWLLQCLLAYYDKSAGRVVDGLRHQLRRTLYYKQENARRRSIAAERRPPKRTTTNPCPTKKQVRDAWDHRKDSLEAMVRLASLIEDLTCYFDCSLRFTKNGHVRGRSGGVKAWLQKNTPALSSRYTALMRYNLLAQKLRQLTGLKDPTPLAQIVEEDGPTTECSAATDEDTTTPKMNTLSAELIQARTFWREIATGTRPKLATLLALLDARIDSGD